MEKSDLSIESSILFQSGQPVRPNVFSFLDYRAFLKAYMTFRKELKSTYSYTVFGRKAGITSDLARCIMIGERNLVDERIHGFVQACELSPQEATYFEALVRWNQATSEERKATLYKSLQDARPTQATLKLEEEQSKLFSKWYLPAIYELINLKDFQCSGKWISDRLGNNVHKVEADEALETLERLGLIVSENGRMRPTHQFVEGLQKNAGTWLLMFHDRMNRLGIKSLHQTPSEKREFGAVSLSIKKKDLQDMKTLIREFQTKLLKFNTVDATAEEVYQVNVQCFPLTSNGDPS